MSVYIQDLGYLEIIGDIEIISIEPLITTKCTGCTLGMVEQIGKCRALPLSERNAYASVTSSAMYLRSVPVDQIKLSKWLQDGCWWIKHWSRYDSLQWPFVATRVYSSLPINGQLRTPLSQVWLHIHGPPRMYPALISLARFFGRYESRGKQN